jgi:HEPN domain-containing protein
MSAADRTGTVHEYITEWVRKAEEDYETAITLIRKRKRRTPNVVCFHCQQRAEKYLKAFLVQQGVIFSKTHDLRELRRLAVETDPAIDLITALLLDLNPYAVEFRYPGKEAAVEEAYETVTAMKTVRRFLRSKLGLPE